MHKIHVFFRYIGAIFSLKTTWFVIGLILLGVLLQVGYNEYAKHTFLKDFYTQVAQAKKHSEELTFPHFVARVDYSEDTRGARHTSWLDNCSVAGVYRNYETNKTIYGARTCSKGTISYYRLDAIDNQTVDATEQQLITLGWQSQETDESRHSIKDDLLHGNYTHSYSFRRSDHTLLFLWYINLDSSNGCVDNSQKTCQVLNSNTSTYRYYMAVEIGAYKDYTD